MSSPAGTAQHVAVSTRCRNALASPASAGLTLSPRPGRLDSKGERYGKVLEFRHSELRVVELLESLCSRMGDYALWTPLTEGRAAEWVRVSGARKHEEAAADTTLQGAKAKTHGREIESFCGMLVESAEEQVRTGTPCILGVPEGWALRRVTRRRRPVAVALWDGP